MDMLFPGTRQTYSHSSLSIKSVPADSFWWKEPYQYHCQTELSEVQKCKIKIISKHCSLSSRHLSSKSNLDHGLVLLVMPVREYICTTISILVNSVGYTLSKTTIFRPQVRVIGFSQSRGTGYTRDAGYTGIYGSCQIWPNYLEGLGRSFCD